MFEYSFSYITESDIESQNPPITEKECVDIECSTQGWEDIDVTIENLTYALKEVTTDVAHCGVYNYSVSFNGEEVLTIKIKFVNKSKNNTEEYANKVLEILKQSMVVFK